MILALQNTTTSTESPMVKETAEVTTRPEYTENSRP